MTKGIIRIFGGGHESDVDDLGSSRGYLEFITETWHNRVPETRGYTVCPKQEATHVVFSRLDLALAGEYGEDLSIHRVYPIMEDEELGDFLIVDDKGKVIVRFDLSIPCDYLKEIEEKKHTDNSEETASNNVVSFLDYKNRRSNSSER
ncbi:hypothetical protein [Virgibacillus sp. SK37]|uniref:hypothetical protein n=1 Tax=Virgibacillus sp. SK37 TaxID=403957 RepID=UPI0004D15DAC|nr:hypothetical protein [Virgibacillus sp. SK37]AIF45082.1 hypothetical protein X953_01340 [Virgibacillus sp. SK37]